MCVCALDAFSPSECIRVVFHAQSRFAVVVDANAWCAAT
jgi:hypothetical protein